MVRPTEIDVRLRFFIPDCWHVCCFERFGAASSARCKSPGSSPRRADARADARSDADFNTRTAKTASVGQAINCVTVYGADCGNIDSTIGGPPIRSRPNLERTHSRAAGLAKAAGSKLERHWRSAEAQMAGSVKKLPRVARARAGQTSQPHDRMGVTEPAAAHTSPAQLCGDQETLAR